MKKLAKQLTVIFSAAVMTVLSAGILVSAAENAPAETAPTDTSQTETPKYTGWEPCETGWLYLRDGVPITSDSYRIDGVYYRFSVPGTCIGTVTGWSGKRYYKDGLPHTGWVEDNAGKQYCLDGYPVTGDFQIGDTVYSFDRKGIYTGESTPALLTASCAESVSADAEKIPITVKYNDGNNNIMYGIGEPAKMEHWENGKWKRCGKSSQYAVDDIMHELGGLGDCSVNSAEVMFYPNRYMGGDMPDGYYRIVVPCNYSKTQKDIYAIFEAVPAVEVKPTKEVFLTNGRNDTTISIIAMVNSKKETLKPETLASSLKLEIMKKTVLGWEPCEDNGYSAGYTDSENELEIAAEFPAEAGYYKAMINLGGKDYSVPFRVTSIAPIPWLDEYSLKNNDISVSFTLYNRYEETVKVGTDLINLVKKENGQWTDMQDRAARFDCIETDPAYTALDADQKTALTFDLSDLYDTSKLTAGDYAVWIDGAGYAEFRLTDKETKSGDFPFAGIKAGDVKEIQLIMQECGGDHETKVSFKKGEYFDRTLDHLRQLKFEKAYEKYSNDKVGFGGFDVVVRLNGGKKKTLSYRDSDAVIYNGGKVYKCNWQVYHALKDFFIEDSGIDKDYYGYR
ncbi:MAG: hypothetical protein OSJ54_08025 [Oscillospiraceae bacterium]|nr:hypothetical protein [Oscillospiraceae bacterium]